jgi:hypothetical protein
VTFAAAGLALYGFITFLMDGPAALLISVMFHSRFAAAAAAALLSHWFFAGLALYGFITFLMDGPAALLIGVTGLKVVPPFDKPWLSETLADFWSRSVGALNECKHAAVCFKCTPVAG